MCTPYSETAQGIEIQFQTNYLSHFYLTQLLLPTILTTSQTAENRTVRIVNVSSSGHAKLAPNSGTSFDDLNLKTASTWTRYGHSKLANVLHAKELARRYGGGEGNDRKGRLVAVSLHPGTVKTNLSAGPRGSTPFYRIIQPLVEWGAPGPEEGDWTSLWCAVSPDLRTENNGGYFAPVGKRTRASRWGEDEVMAGKLWEWTEGKLKECGF
jgi:NAD(P)-dependent dehydrogenase (short-subunit alcohol dehydrogenase family)